MFDQLQNQFGRTLKILSGQAKIRPAHIEEALQQIKTSLLEADVQFSVVNRFLDQVKTRALGTEVAQSLSPYQQFIKILHKEMLEVFGAEEPLELSGKPPIIALMVGLQGTGKTTSAVKIAFHLKRKLKRKPLLVSVDVTRPAAIEQLERLSKDAKLDYFNTPSLKPLERAQAAIKYAQTYGLDFVLIDTAGRLSIDDELMNELKVLKSELKPQIILYAVDAMSGQQGLAVASGFSSQIGLTGAVLTKTDGDTRGGVAFSIRESLKIPLQFVGTGEKTEALEVFHPARWVSRILGMGDVESLIEKVETASEEAGAPGEDEAKRMAKGELTLLDFQKQMKMMSKMGSLGGLMGMIPGMSQMAAKVDHEALEKRLKKVDAMINSMTNKERLKPDLLNGDRRRRIAKGSGTQVEDLNQFMREFTEMQKMMKRFSGKKMKGLAQMFGR
ncbi:MAG: ffh [Bacteriovoracaceae bacterium]|nr:ffh [Bacteriovoracaceae bacterium]